MKRRSVLRQTPLARFLHQHRYLDQLAADTLFRSIGIERRQKEKAIDDAHIRFLRWPKRQAK